MKTVNYHIPKEIFDADRPTQLIWFNEHLPASIMAGYGFYGIQETYKEGNDYFAKIFIGDSCD